MWSGETMMLMAMVCRMKAKRRASTTSRSRRRFLRACDPRELITIRRLLFWPLLKDGSSAELSTTVGIAKVASSRMVIDGIALVANSPLLVVATT